MKAVITPPQRPVLTEQKKMNIGPRQFKFKLQHTLGGDRPIVDISRRGQTRAAVGLGKDHRKIPVIVLD